MTLPPHCPVCMGLRTHAPDCPEAFYPEEPEEEETEMSMSIDIDCFPDEGPLDVEVDPYTHCSSGKAYLTIGNKPLLGNRVRFHGLTAKQLQDLAVQIAKAAADLAAANEPRQEPPQDVPFPATDLSDALKESPQEFADGFSVQERIVYGRPIDTGNPVG